MDKTGNQPNAQGQTVTNLVQILEGENAGKKAVVKMPSVQEQIVENLEKILRRAKEGDIKSFVFCCRTADRTTATSWHDGDLHDMNLEERQALVSVMQQEITYTAVMAMMASERE